MTTALEVHGDPRNTSPSRRSVALRRGSIVSAGSAVLLLAGVLWMVAGTEPTDRSDMVEYMAGNRSWFSATVVLRVLGAVWLLCAAGLIGSVFEGRGADDRLRSIGVGLLLLSAVCNVYTGGVAALTVSLAASTADAGTVAHLGEAMEELGSGALFLWPYHLANVGWVSGLIVLGWSIRPWRTAPLLALGHGIGAVLIAVFGYLGIPSVYTLGVAAVVLGWSVESFRGVGARS